MKKFFALLLAAVMLSGAALSANAGAVLPLLSSEGSVERAGNLGRLGKIENKVEGDGATTISAGYAKVGATVKVTAAPAEGRELAVIAVLDAMGNEQKVEAVGDGAYVFVMPEAAATIHTVYVPVAGEDGATRGVVAEALWLMAGQPYVNYQMPFEDVEEGTDQAEAIRWASALKLMNGYSEAEFGADDGVTREQLCTILYRYAQTFGEGFTGAWVFLLPYADYLEVSEWANEAVHWCCMKKIVEADEEGNLNPAEALTMEETSAMIAKMAQALAE